MAARRLQWKLRLGGAAGVLLVAIWACDLAAQAWTPPRNRGNVSLSYNYTHVDEHLLSDGQTLDLGEIDGNTISLYGDYGILNRLALSGYVAFVSSSYDGTAPESEIDLTRNSSFQDWGAALRYSLLLDPLVITPFVGYSGPTNDYAIVGHTAVGTGLETLQLGLNLGRGLAPFLPTAYVHLNYGYSWVEDIGDFSMDQSVLNFEMGYFLNRTIGLRFLSNFLYVHDGFDWSDEGHWEHAPGHVHDSAAQARHFRLGGGVSYSLPRFVDFSLSYIGTVSGESTHDAQGIVFSTSFSF